VRVGSVESGGPRAAGVVHRAQAIVSGVSVAVSIVDFGGPEAAVDHGNVGLTWGTAEAGLGLDWPGASLGWTVRLRAWRGSGPSAEFTGGDSRFKGAFGVGFADSASLHP
jgi:hypothetical protein